MSDQYRRIVSAIEYTLDQIRSGPKTKEIGEGPTAYERRVELWYTCKYKFALYAIKCLKSIGKEKAEVFLLDLRQLGDDV